MFNAGIIATPNLNGWSAKATDVQSGNIVLSNKKKTAATTASAPDSYVYAVKGVSSGILDWWITLETGVFDSRIGVVGVATKLAGFAFDAPYVYWWRDAVSSPDYLNYHHRWSGGVSGGGTWNGDEIMTPGYAIPQTFKISMNADTKRATISTISGASHFRDFDAPDNGPWFPALTLLDPSASVSITYVKPEGWP